MRNYDLVIVTMEPFPYGQAATNRILSYVKGIAQLRKVLYLNYGGPKEGENPNKDRVGQFANIDFQYMGRTSVNKRPNALSRALSYYCRKFRLYYTLLFLISFRSMLIVSRSPELAKAMSKICKIKRARIYNDVTEAAGSKGDANSLEERKKSCELFDGVITISQGIYDFFDNIQPQKKFLLPVLVDMSRFMTSKKKEKYFFYCSGANLERDGLIDCLYGFLEFNSRVPGYIFEIATSIDPNIEYHRRCKAIIDAHSDVIKYLGSIPSYQIPEKLAYASALMITPHKEYDTKGFPTKLGEYLASGTPTICSSINDIVSVLDEDCAYMVNPNSPYEIADQLQSIISDPKMAEILAQNSRNLMIKKYTFDSYANELFAFLKI